MLLLTLRLGSLFTMPSKRSLSMTIWLRWQRPMKGPAKSIKYTSKLTQWHPSNYSNPLIQTSALSMSFQKGPPKKTCGKCGCSHNHSECLAHSTTCSKCGHINHWAQQCRSSGRRNSSTGHSPSLGRPQNRQTVQCQAVWERQGMWRRQWQAEIYSQQEARPRPWPWRWQAPLRWTP